MNDEQRAATGEVTDPTYSVRPNLIVCTLEDSLTPAEKRMAEMGEHQRLRDLRLCFQHATEEQFYEVIERVTGRKVRAFISGLDTNKDVAAELFYLEA
jgi:uncharacterized protein YbcI